MALANTIKQMNNLLSQISQDLMKAEGGNKAASQRVRTGTVKLEKTAKMYRKESVRNEKLSPNKRKASSKRPTLKSAAKKSTQKNSQRHGSAKKTIARKTTAKPNAFSFIRKQTAKLLKRPSANR